MIPVTKPYLPPHADYTAYTRDIWERGWLTNNGPLVQQLESSLRSYLDLPYVQLLNNGTIALQIALKALDIQGEVITTPFSYVATTSSIVWEGCKPIFVDIDAATLNIDASKIEAAITPRTQAILATHVYGNPCDVEAIAAIAAKHHLKVIYDAAHAFGTRYKGQSLFGYGHVSTASFHATKLFHTIEGGAVITRDTDVAAKMALLRNFGHTSPYTFNGAGINGKSSEFHAAMGLLVLKDMQAILDKRKAITQQYDTHLAGTAATRPQVFDEEHTDYNHAYYPIILPSEEVLLEVMAHLEVNNILSRRYFYPSLNTVNYVEPSSCPISEDICTRVLCLPMYHLLAPEEIDNICKLVLEKLG